MEKNITTQSTHELGIEAAFAAAKNSKENVLIRGLRDPKRIFVNSVNFDKPCEVIFHCSRSSKNPGKIQNNISAEYVKNQTTKVGQFSNKVYILVYLDEETGKNRFFLIAFDELCSEQYEKDRTDSKRPDYNFRDWTRCGESGRNNMDVEELARRGYEIWK